MKKELSLYVRNIYGLDSDQLADPATVPFERVDFFKDETVTLTQTIKNSKSPEKVFTDFTQSFTIPASPVNNKIFRHYYNNGIFGFDARIKVPARLELNLMPFKDGYLKLESVDMEFGKPKNYKITFFGNTVSLTELFGEDELSNLDWLNNFNLLYSAGNLKDRLSTNNNNVTVDSVTYTNPIIAPLITHTRRLYYNSNPQSTTDGNLYYESGVYKGVRAEDLKYAIRNEVIIKAIEKAYPSISFGSSATRFFRNNNAAFYDMYMWLSRRKGSVLADSDFETPTYPTFVPFASSSQTLGSSDPVTGITVNVPSEYQASFWVPSITCGIDVNSGSSSIVYNYDLLYNGISINQTIGVTGDQSITIPQSYQNVNSGTFTLIIAPQSSMTIDQVTFTLTRTDAENDDEVNSIFQTGQFNITAAFEFSITQQIPQMKIIDYLSNLFKMFNLIAYVTYDPSTATSTLEVQDYNTYYYDYTNYDLGYKSLDITEYISIDKNNIGTSLPYSEVKFAYKDLKTFFSAFHKQIFNTDWGTETYRGQDNQLFSGSTYNVDIAFQHQKYERLVNISNDAQTTIQWGWTVDDNQQSYIGDPLQFYAYFKTNGTGLSFLETASSVDELTSYWLPANSLITGDQTAGKSLNFYAEPDEWTGSINLETLFKNYYETYMQGIFDVSKRIIRIDAYLPDSILNDLQLNNRFIIGDTTYQINSITTDFATGKSQLELLTQDLKNILI